MTDANSPAPSRVDVNLVRYVRVFYMDSLCRYFSRCHFEIRSYYEDLLDSKYHRTSSKANTVQVYTIRESLLLWQTDLHLKFRLHRDRRRPDSVLEEVVLSETANESPGRIRSLETRQTDSPRVLLHDCQDTNERLGVEDEIHCNAGELEVNIPRKVDGDRGSKCSRILPSHFFR